MPKILEFIPKPPICSICNKPVEPGTAVDYQDGKPVHEECYVLKLRLEEARKPPKTHGP
jgi:hypothetical protein